MGLLENNRVRYQFAQADAHSRKSEVKYCTYLPACLVFKSFLLLAIDDALWASSGSSSMIVAVVVRERASIRKVIINFEKP